MAEFARPLASSLSSALVSEMSATTQSFRGGKTCTEILLPRRQLQIPLAPGETQLCSHRNVIKVTSGGQFKRMGARIVPIPMFV